MNMAGHAFVYSGVKYRLKFATPEETTNNDGNTACPLSDEMVRRPVSDHAAMPGGYVGSHSPV